MKELDYGKNYKYAHAYENNFVEDNFFPEQLKQKKFLGATKQCRRK